MLKGFRRTPKPLATKGSRKVRKTKARTVGIVGIAPMPKTPKIAPSERVSLERAIRTRCGIQATGLGPSDV